MPLSSLTILIQSESKSLILDGGGRLFEALNEQRNSFLILRRQTRFESTPYEVIIVTWRIRSSFAFTDALQCILFRYLIFEQIESASPHFPHFRSEQIYPI